MRLETKPEEAAVVVARPRRVDRSSSDSRWPPARPRSRSPPIDWHEKQKLLKLGFAFDVHADRSAAETQFGHLYRRHPHQHLVGGRRFEICAHRFVHVGEPGYGVAVANDSTYGYDVHRHTRVGGGTTTTVRQSLLRAPLYPDPYADQGGTRCGSPSGRAAASPRRSRRATGPTCRSAGPR